MVPHPLQDPSSKEVASYLDIDSTLSGGLVQAHIGFYNAVLELAMTPEELAELDNYATVFEVPKLKAFIERDRDTFEAERKKIRENHKVHVAFTPIAQAVEGAQLIANRTRFYGYYTVRPEAVRNATVIWLGDNNFPASRDAEEEVDLNTPAQRIEESIVMFESPQEKLVGILLNSIVDATVTPLEEGEKITYTLKSDPEIALLVDDSLAKLLDAAQTLLTSNPELRPAFDYLILVAFGHQEEKLPESVDRTTHIDQVTGITVHALPTWETHLVRTLLDTIAGPARY